MSKTKQRIWIWEGWSNKRGSVWHLARACLIGCKQQQVVSRKIKMKKATVVARKYIVFYGVWLVMWKCKWERLLCFTVFDW